MIPRFDRFHVDRGTEALELDPEESAKDVDAGRRSCWCLPASVYLTEV